MDIRDLTVGRVKIQDEAVTTFPYAITIGAQRVIDQSQWATLQTLSFTKGRNAPMPVHIRCDVSAGAGPGAVARLRMRRNGVLMREWDDINRLEPNEYTIVDIDTAAVPTTYTLEVMPRQGPYIDFTNSFIGVLNAHR
ncbi:MAG: hypothetical protein FJX25_05845 [Alphaproteobacteria bacterium]|nr:hypothetical protein [Alphaproteobacteria bacterium]